MQISLRAARVNAELTLIEAAKKIGIGNHVCGELRTQGSNP